MKQGFNLLWIAGFFLSSAWAEDHGIDPLHNYRNGYGGRKSQLEERLKEFRGRGKRAVGFQIYKGKKTEGGELVALPPEEESFLANQTGPRARRKEPKILKRGPKLLFGRRALENIRLEKPEMISFPFDTGKGILNLSLFRSEITTPEFEITDGKGQKLSKPDGVYYQGIVERGITEGAKKSTVSLTIFRHGKIMLVIRDGDKEYTVGNIATSQLPEQHAIDAESVEATFQDTELLPVPEALCGGEQLAPETETTPVSPSSLIEQMPEIAAAPTYVNAGKPVSIYFVVDNATFKKFGSNTTTVTTFVTGLFNEVSTLYVNEQIELKMAGLKIWTIPEPWSGLATATVGSSTYLNAFRTYMSAQGYPGHIAHLLTAGPTGLGGVAYLDAMCSKYYGFAFSNIYTNYLALPSYSWSVHVVAHEMGHNLGSPHTHSCSWIGADGSSGKAIDGCYQDPGATCSAGPIPPANGGTVMSYCHLASSGINLALGFGSQPGDKIRTKVAAGACLSDPNYNIDNTLPVVSFSTPASNATVSGTVSITGSAIDDRMISTLEIKDGTTTLTTINNIYTNYTYNWNSVFTYSWDTTTATNGAHSLKLVATDMSGNVSTVATRTVTVSNGTAPPAPPDTTPPVVAFGTTPASGATVTGTVTLSATASDASGISNVTFFYSTNGTTFTQIGSPVSISPYSVAFSVAALPYGNLTLKATALDTKGNSASTQRVVKVKDIIAPVVAITNPLAGAILKGNSLPFTASASDTGGSGVSKVEFYRGTYLLSTDTTAPYEGIINTLTLVDGAYSYSAKAYDVGGNITTSTVNVTVKNAVAPPTTDTVAPVVSLISHSNNASVLAWNVIRLEAEASDNASVSSVQFVVNGSTLCTITSGAQECFLATTQRGKTFTITVKATDPTGNVGQQVVTIKSN